MSKILGEMLNKTIHEHEETVKKLELLIDKNFECKIQNENEKLYIIEVLEYNLNSIKEQFDLLSKYYDFSVLETIMLKSTIDLVLMMIDSFLVNASNRGEE